MTPLMTKRAVGYGRETLSSNGSDLRVGFAIETDDHSVTLPFKGITLWPDNFTPCMFTT